MRVSHEWLSEYVELEGVGPEWVAQLLTLSGTEVESWERHGAGLGQVVVARALGVERLAGSDHLWRARAAVPGEPEAEVICGAPNLVSGALVAWARPGSSLPGGQEIGARRIRGVLSQGMFCAPDELGLGSDHEGVLLLPEDEVEPGQPLDRIFPADVVYDLEILSNRADCLCHLGVARELAAVLDRPLRPPQDRPPERAGRAAAETVRLHLESEADCPLYIAECLELERQPPAPLWLQRRLMAVGARPISGPVDLANYVMLELGQPLHTFDLDRLAGPGEMVELGVRRGRPGEQLACLDGVVRPLEGALVIASGERPVALAGIIGGAESAIGADTRRVLLEAASFDWVAVRRGGRRLGLRTEASARFERALSPALAEPASRRFVALWAGLLGGGARPGPVLAGALPAAGEPIRVSSTRMSSLLGMEVASEEGAGALRRLGFQVDVQGDQLAVRPAPERTDVRIPEDVTEEVGRILGYERLPSRLPPLRQPPGGRPGLTRAERLAAEICLGAGFTEAVSSSLVGAPPPGLPQWLRQGSPVRLSNPLSSQLGELRSSLLPGLLQACQLNQSRGLERTRLFEWGRAFRSPGQAPAERPREEELLSLVDQGSGPEVEPPEARLGRLLALVQGLGELLGEAVLEFRPQTVPGLEPGRSALVLVAGEARGLVGQLAAPELARLELRGSAVLAELGVGGWFRDGGRPGRGRHLAKTPALSVDLAVTVPLGAELGPALQACRQAGVSALEDAHLVDEYRGGSVPEGRKGWTFRLRLRDPERTLTHREGESMRAAILAALARATGAELRSA